MSSEKKRSGLKDALDGIKNLERLPEQASSGIAPGLLLLRTWQQNRLKSTYQDFLAKPVYAPACEFFLSEIYAPGDFSQRDQDFEYLYEQMARILPGFLLSLARNAIELNSLTKELDEALIRALVAELGVTDSITKKQYAQAYRICDNYEDRARQIEMILTVGKQVSLGTRIPLVGMTLRLARSPAQFAGWQDAHDFFERGFSAFKGMGKKSKYFLETIYKREMGILERIFKSDPDPFLP